MPDPMASRRRQLIEAATRIAETEGGEQAARLLRHYYRHVASEDLCAKPPEVLAGILDDHLRLARERAEATAGVRVFRPTLGTDGWTSSHSVVQVVTDDMPFLVDSVAGAISRGNESGGAAVHLVIHPLVEVRRDAAGALEEVLDPQPEGGDWDRPYGQLRESWITMEIDPLDDEGAAALEGRLRQVLADVRVGVEDWQRMRRRCLDIADEIEDGANADLDPREVAQAVNFLRWMADNHFTFLGYRDYSLSPGERGEAISADQGTGLGILRWDPAMGRQTAVLSDKASRKAHEHRPLIITKANARSTVHRPVHLDYVSIKRFDASGEVVGEHRFLGLFTATAYTESVVKVPIVRDKVRSILDRSGFTSDSHSGKDLLEVLEDYPRDELLQASEDHLFDVATAVLPLQDRRTTALFLRDDEFGRFVSCVVYLPRDHYNTAVRLRIADLLRRTFDGESVEYTTRVSESALARLHFVVRMPHGVPIPELSPAERDRLEERLVDAARTWEEKLHAAARDAHDEDEGARLRLRYGKAFPTAYEQRFGMAATLADITHLERVGAPDADPDRTDMVLYKGDSPDGMRRFKLFRRGPISLTDVLPRFTDMGVEVVDERPFEVTRSDGMSLHIYDFGLRVASEELWAQLPHEEMRDLFESAFAAVWQGRAESDGFNALVLGAGLTWRQVVILRTVAKYLRQTRSTFSQDYLESALIANADIARMLVELFETRFDPSRYATEEDGDAAAARREEDAEEVAGQIQAALDEVGSLDQDRMIRAFLAVIRAGLRTNFYQPADDGGPKPYVALKVRPRAIPDLPEPRPQFEIWVYSPRVEGVHLRFGPVARGGLRWSDRREDFRTEILGLVKAQMVKNAVIVPTGSKGGFFAKQLPDPAVDRAAWMEEGVAAYRMFISALLDITDNRVEGRAVPPANVVRHDGDDPYLVVAADKGTATFSDIANEVAASYGFWLDDAFASGGSAGYDHKAMGITARGAWESVKRHFREMDIDTQAEDFTVVGIGDMSGDVFGNGMLLSEHIRLVAAFDHRHIFIDPDPEAASSYAERRRLFDLPRSSWADYDTSLISEGGGVFPRTLKSIPISPQMAKALGLPDGTRSMTPAELMRGVLLAPVDLLWNGGIGTYVKASTEDNGSVGDRANDAIRVDGNALRCKVVGEGGNLGLTQLGRIEAALGEVRVNTDAIDNSAGVDTSDHEVNIKIPFGEVVRRGDLDLDARNELLASMTDDVAEDVLRDNYEQNVLLGNARAQEHQMLSVHQRLMHWLEERGDLDRELEFLPSDADLMRRSRDGLGLKSPEFSVLVAYTKLALKEDLLPGELPDDPWFRETLMSYFPPAIRERYGEDLLRHPLRREIVTNAVANSIVNRGGITFAFRAIEETGATAEQVARAYVVCREIFDLSSFVAQVEALDNVVTTSAQTRLYLEFRRLLDRSIRWFLTARPTQLDIAAEIGLFQSVVAELGARIPELLQGDERTRLERRSKEFERQGIPAELAVRTASLLDAYALLDVVDIATDTGETPEDVASLYFVLSERFAIDAMLHRVTALPRADQWDALARGAARDDLYAVLEALTRSVIDVSTAQREAGPEARFEVWAKANSESLDRARRSLAGITRLESPNLAALSVALRTLRGVVRSGSGSGAASA
ncbi:NAD-specific glutamate dehydrogenase [Nostocoides japonicum T1-X7]|uniref:NAD-specific glutamate dehydrogenase n=2 Tax=Nostocoides japonicum TaxID=99481 RepID=A0A077M3E2_9MICO|nr:NAD-glutamate dehydrogenase [Tetrasphaera japonica]CCH80301.1 NAD-specific glutamate dehydrogenase [Tetrasphaera japonica T1-X7]